MRVVFIVNDRLGLSPEQTTTLLMSAALRRGHEVRVCGVGDMTAGEDRSLVASGCVLDDPATDAVVRHLTEREPEESVLTQHDLCVIRTNPGRDAQRRAEHTAALRLLEGLSERGVTVVNNPRGLSRALTKLSLLDLPRELTPRTLVTRDAEEIERFLARESDRVVIKPLDGTRGRDVFVLEAIGSRANRKQIIDVVLRQGYAMVQEFVAGAEYGDVRVTVVGGKIVEADGRAAAIARVPSQDDFRSNLHAGGTAQPVEVTTPMRETVREIAPYLAREGLLHVGVDFVGGRILELNVFSPGGLYPSERLYERDFSGAVMEAFERHAARR